MSGCFLPIAKSLVCASFLKTDLPTGPSSSGGGRESHESEVVIIFFIGRRKSTPGLVPDPQDREPDYELVHAPMRGAVSFAAGTLAGLSAAVVYARLQRNSLLSDVEDAVNTGGTASVFK